MGLSLWLPVPFRLVDIAEEHLGDRGMCRPVVVAVVAVVRGGDIRQRSRQSFLLFMNACCDCILKSRIWLLDLGDSLYRR